MYSFRHIQDLSPEFANLILLNLGDFALFFYDGIIDERETARSRIPVVTMAFVYDQNILENLDIDYRFHGQYRRQTLQEPAEYPELEITEVRGTVNDFHIGDPADYGDFLKSRGIDPANYIAVEPFDTDIKYWYDIFATIPFELIQKHFKLEFGFPYTIPEEDFIYQQEVIIDITLVPLTTISRDGDINLKVV